MMGTMSGKTNGTTGPATHKPVEETRVSLKTVRYRVEGKRVFVIYAADASEALDKINEACASGTKVVHGFDEVALATFAPFHVLGSEGGITDEGELSFGLGGEAMLCADNAPARETRK
jgi:hypothetical protein